MTEDERIASYFSFLLDKPIIPLYILDSQEKSRADQNPHGLHRKEETNKR